MAYTTIYPTLDIYHVSATSMRNPDYFSGIFKSYYPHYAFDPTKSLTGPSANNCWISLQRQYIKQRIWANLNSPHIITKLYYENYHDGHIVCDFNPAIYTNDQYDGAYQGSIWGSHAQPEAYGNYQRSTLLWEGNFEKHSNFNSSDPKYIIFSNTTSYQYYYIDIANNYSGNFGIGFRRLAWQENI